MVNFLEKNYWEKKYYSTNKKSHFLVLSSFLPNGTEKFFTPFLKFKELQILKKYLKIPKNSKIVEIGSAPGKFISELAIILKSIPYGIEYSKSGADLNRKNFKKYGFSEKNVLEVDFFSDDIIKQYKESFDLVLSRGFVEHFDNPYDVVKRHLELLKPDGYLVVSIPNKSGLNKKILSYLNKNSLEKHNLNIMNIKNFLNLFPESILEKKLLRYYGIFDCYQFNPSQDKKRIYSFLMKIQKIIYPFYYFIPDEPSFDSSFLSPSLIYIGKKKRRI